MNNDSEKTDNTMNNDPEKIDNTMNNDSEKTDKTWKKNIVYLVHCAVHLVSRLLLLLAILVPVLLLLILIVISTALFLASILVWSPELLDYEVFKNLNKRISDNASLIQIITSFIPIVLIVLIWFLGRELKNDIKHSLSNIKAKIVKVVRGRWFPKMNIKKNLSVTWRCYRANIWLLIKEMFSESKKLLVALLFLLFITFCGYIIEKKLRDDTTPGSKELRSNVMAIKAKADSIAISDFDMWRDGVTNTLDDIKKNIVLPKPSISYPFEKGARFSLVYREGNLKTKEGICPEDSNREWLELFKAAISESSQDKDGHIKLKVQGFASVAPVTVNGRIALDTSNALNREISNQRAEALIYFLTTSSYDSTECKIVLNNDLRWGRVEGKPHTRRRPDTLAWKGSGFTVTYDDSPRVQWKGQHFTVAYQPWKDYKEMESNKPMKDSSLDNRRFDLEFLNRSVQIIIEDNAENTN